MQSTRARRLADFGAALSVYLRPRVLVIWLLGFSAGLPLSLSGATLAIWMADRGIDLGTIGLLSLAGLPYTIKFFWAPLVDALDVPLLGRSLGHRRGWLMATQALLMAAILFLGTRDPVSAPLAIGIGALLVAAASATQDIVIDAYRIESLQPDEQAAGMASYVAAYRIGLLVSGAGAIWLTAWLEGQGWSKLTVWPAAYALAAGLVLVGTLAVLLAREPARSHRPRTTAPMGKRLAGTAAGAFSDFLTRPYALGALALVVAYKLCDALAGVMTGPFVLALGYDKATYAEIVKGLGLLASLLGGFAGGLIAQRMALAPALWLGAILQMASNLGFAWLAFLPPSTAALAATIVLENAAGGIGTVIFVAYLSGLCASPAHTATQYALLTALAAVGRTVIASVSGFAAVTLGWPLFFVATTLAALPGLALLALLQRRRHFADLMAARPA